MDLPSQLPTLLGVAVGGILTSVSAAAVTRAQWKRTISVRWDEQRLGAYIAYMNEAKVLATTALRIVAGRGIVLGKAPDSVAPLESAEGYEQLNVAEGRRAERAEAVLLLGDTPTLQRMSQLTETVWRLVALARRPDTTLESWSDAYAAYHRARLDFYASARPSMGIPSAEIGAGTYWVDSATAPPMQRSSKRRQPG